jgi:ATP-binding cassette subfamily A (ABC1) protein 3
LLPVIFISFISFSRFLFVPPAKYGVGTPASVINLADALAAHNNKPLVFVHNNVGSHVLQLIQTMQEQLKGNGIIKVLSGEDALKKECKQSLRGVSPCFAAVAFQKTPDNGPKWNYTLNTESSIADQLDVDNHNNGIQQ